jgi:isoleucyl-tRNA synthetase
MFMGESRVIKSETAQREEEVLAFWNEHGIFEKTLEKESPQGEYVFYDGPPFATGLPHHGSLLSSIVKDVVPRYQTMRGFRVDRRWGWDTHGLPIESLVEKELGLKSKKDILEIGIKTFNEKARSMVLGYVAEWEHYVNRIGRWVDFKNSYKTMDNTYIESVWWALKKLWDDKKLYEGNKVLMYCPHCETPLAKAEIAMDNTYQDVTETAVTIKLPLIGHDDTYFLAWTTTPWTLPGNVALAVGKNIDYVQVKTDSENYILAKERLDVVFPGQTYTVVKEQKGSELVGLHYQPLFGVQAITQSENAHKVYAADFVTTEDGTGIVHTAVMYGEDDFELGKKEGLPMVQLLNNNATYNDYAPEFLRGQHIKKANTMIIDDLQARGLLFEASENTHSYPHCYRCGTPLIYNAVSSWFLDIQSVKARMLAENEKVNWVPDHLKHGRFKHIVESAPDWTISRNRFWASPLPIWKCGECHEVKVIGSLKELREQAVGDVAEDIDLHRPYIDEVKLRCSCGAEMVRVPEVVDCWVESGSMPFAQNHNLGASIGKPVVADFIAEYIAQTRTWFYYMHAMSVLLFDQQAFRNVVSTGTILAADGQKISKSKRNYTDPLLLIDQYGADAIRLYLMGSPVMQAEDVSFRDEEVREMHARVLNMFWNTYQFYALYADMRDVKTEAKKSGNVLDRWIRARLLETAKVVTESMDAYTTPPAVRALRDFVDDYSTWYVRRSRDRMKGEAEEDKQYALSVQYEVLTTVATLMAPLAPFIAEAVYRGAHGLEESVHLEAWPRFDEGIDTELIAAMKIARSVVSGALEKRSEAGIKVRQPLAMLTIGEELPEELLQVIADEVNVKQVVVSLGSPMELDTALTPELEQEGMVRELVRAVQGARKDAALKPSQKVTLTIDVPQEVQRVVEGARAELARVAGVGEVVYAIVGEESHTVSLGEHSARFSIAA